MAALRGLFLWYNTGVLLIWLGVSHLIFYTCPVAILMARYEHTCTTGVWHSRSPGTEVFSKPLDLASKQFHLAMQSGIVMYIARYLYFQI